MPLLKWQVGAAILASFPGAVAAADYPPFNIEDVGFAKDCDPNPALIRLMTMMTGPSRQVADDGVPDIDGPLYEAISGDTTHSLMLDTPQKWHCLGLIGVELAFGIERGPANYVLLFEDNAEKVRSVWNEMGWKLPATDDVRDIEGLEGYAFIGVSRRGQSASVGCFRD